MEILNLDGKAISFQWSEADTLSQEAWNHSVEHETEGFDDGEMEMVDEDIRACLSAYDRRY